MRKNLKSMLLLYSKGLAMGAADVVPGVSGGTIAFITGIYGQLLESISAFTSKDTYKYLLKGEFVAFWQRVNGSFVVVLMAGIVTSIVSFARIISYLLEEHPEMIWSFFFGLVLVSCFFVGREVSRWDWQAIVSLLIGAIAAYFVTEMAPTVLEPTHAMVFFSGAIAICAMILPGISGSFILLTMGMYGHIIGAIKDFDLLVIAIFSAGNGLGILAFSRFLNWLLHSHGKITLAFLTGLLVGSLNKVWPWKHTLSYRTNSHGQEVPFLQDNVWPGSYQALSGSEAHFGEGLGLMALGVLVVLLLSMLGSKYKSTHPE